MGIVVRGKRGPVRADAANVVRGQRTRERLLHCARRRILSHGFEALRLDDLARDAEVTKAAVVKSVGGKASILLALGDEDRQTRLAVIRAAHARRTALKRRIADVVRELYVLDLARLNVVMAWIGYQWFWSGDDHVRAQAMIDDTRRNLGELIASASPVRTAPRRVDVLAMRVLASYVIGLRRIRYERASVDQAVEDVLEHVFD
ncbi:MAG: TetR/AcrR family transcriptional regulator [Vicinamibacteria bacterium]|jgi:AcrR family transcriptional regulator